MACTATTLLLVLLLLAWPAERLGDPDSDGDASYSLQFLLRRAEGEPAEASMQWTGSDPQTMLRVASDTVEREDIYVTENCNEACAAKRIMDEMKNVVFRTERDKQQQFLASTYAEHAVASLEESDNTIVNRKIWDRYVPLWQAYLRHDAPEKQYENVGDEWGDVDIIVREWISPYLRPPYSRGRNVAEIGAGGGRVAAKVAPLVSMLHIFDISAAMLEAAKQGLSPKNSNVQYTLLPTSEGFDSSLEGSFDMVYCFDAMVHMEMQTVWRYLQAFHRILRPGGIVFISVGDLMSEQGWDRFSSLKPRRDIPFYFMTEEVSGVDKN